MEDEITGRGMSKCEMTGAAVGNCVLGATDGTKDGRAVGTDDGKIVGICVGGTTGTADGALVGVKVGSEVGAYEGPLDGFAVEGMHVGKYVGI